jgi:hypothetical protein
MATDKSTKKNLKVTKKKLAKKNDSKLSDVIEIKPKAPKKAPSSESMENDLLAKVKVPKKNKLKSKKAQGRKYEKFENDGFEEEDVNVIKPNPELEEYNRKLLFAQKCRAESRNLIETVESKLFYLASDRDIAYEVVKKAVLNHYYPRYRHLSAILKRPYTTLESSLLFSLKPPQLYNIVSFLEPREWIKTLTPCNKFIAYSLYSFIKLDYLAS